MATSKSQVPVCSNYSWKLVLLLMTMGFWLPFSEPAAVARLQYTMDLKSDCVSAGFLDIPRDQITKLYAPSKEIGSNQQVVTCRLQFSPQTDGDTLKVTLTSGSYIEDCDVKLQLQLTNTPTINLGCNSGTQPVSTMSAVNGKADIWLSRPTFQDISYWFEVTVTAVRTEAAPLGGNSGTADIGLIVGITVGVLALVIIAIVLCVCCYRKRQTSNRSKSDNNKDVVTNSLFTNTSHGYENNMAKISFDNSLQKSPKFDKSLLGQNYSRGDENDGKPKSALERFGPPPSHRGQSNFENREFDSAKKNERNYSKPLQNLEERETVKPRDVSSQKVVRDTSEDAQNPPKSLMLSSLHSNVKFRKSFHENEVDAEERIRRVSDHSSVTNSTISTDSDNTTIKKPSLPPVPKSPPRSPSPQRDGKKIAGIFRAGTTSSTSSAEIGRFEDEDSEDRDVKTSDKLRNHHSLRPTTRKNKTDEKPRKGKQTGVREEDIDDRRNREKDMDEKKRRNREDEKRVMKEDIERRRKIEKMLISVDDDDDDRSQITEKEYEGRFKKSASGRKPKSKGQRMGRSKSTGNALDDFDSSSQRSRPKSPGSVRSLNLADDDIDDELDSNYTSFKRSGSKTSLYASRSSLYGRRRKNSMGETVSMSSYMHDDVDSRMGDFDKTHLSHKEKERLFKSTGDLDLSSASAVVFRECATQTGSSKEVYVYGRKTYVKSKPGKRYSRGTQKFPDKERRDSTGSARSGRSTKSNRLKSRSKSQESLRKQKGSRSRDFSDDDSEFSHRQRRKKSQDKDYSDGDVSERSHRQRRKKNHDSDDASERSHRERRKKLKDRDNSEDERSYHHSESRFSDSDQESKRSRNKLREIDNDYYKSKQKAKPNPMPRRKTHDTMTSDSSDSDDNNSQVTSSVAPSSIQQTNEHIAHAAHFAPTGYSVVYPQPGVAYMSTAPGGPPMMFPVTSMPQSAIPQKPSVAPKPNVSKWDQLVNLTEGMKKRRHQMGESVETESVLSSTWSQPVTYASQPHSHYSQSPYTMSQRMPGFVSTYPESIDSTKLPKEHIIGYSRKYASNDSNV